MTTGTSVSLGNNLFVNRFKALSGLSNTSILPQVGDEYSVENVKLKFNKNVNFQYTSINNWIGNITIKILEVQKNQNLFNIKSKISFMNTNNSEINIPNMISDDIVTGLITSTDIIDLRTNNISLHYDDKDNNSGSYVKTLYGKLFLTDFRLSLSVLIVNNTDPNNYINYTSFGYITCNKK